ncbi:MAG: DUF1036 domain-containing protein [Pseudomonadota bacterium]
MTYRFVLGLVTTLIPGTAFAGLEICNQTTASQSIAIGYQADGKWVSEGWWNIPSGACREPVAGDLKTRYYYVHASASARVQHDDSYTFCTQSGVFTIVGDGNCAVRGFETSQFAQIDTGATATHHTHTLVEAVVKHDSAKQPASPTTPSGLIRGQHGEPYTDRLMFQACDVIDGLEACSFVGNGWRFYAFYDDPTPAHYLRQFEGMPPNTPVVVTGDLINHSDRNATLAITKLEPLWGEDPYAGINSALQGDWVLADDPNETMFIFGSEMHSYYKGDLTDTYLLNIKPDCPDSAGAGPVMVQTSVTYGDEYCYLFDNLEGGWMDLIFMGHEALISYRKVN